ncbi:MAG: PD40 domain-containing protein [Candidatus Hydrogenedentota bacterium]|nr:MAG: PD40 domain-containing protein [Candidatus Hydrogenedentota bacterium]
MIQNVIFKVIFILTILIFINCKQQADFPAPKSPYLGQKPPGTTPELFAPGKISQAGFELHSSLAISHDGKEIYFAQLVKDEDRPRNVILLIKYDQKRWIGPEVASFSGTYDDAGPSISANGKRLYFSSNRPIKEGGEVKQDRDIWYLVKRDGSWSEPRHLAGPVNSELTEGAVSVSQKGTMYFYRNVGRDHGWGDIFRSSLIQDEWTEPERLGAPISTEEFECFPVIAPDEHFLIFYARNGSEGTGQYVCFRQSEGTWTAPIHMGESINGGAVAFCSSYSPDGKYFFVLRRRSDSIAASPEDFKEGIYWVDAKIIEKLKPDYLKCKRHKTQQRTMKGLSSFNPNLSTFF